ncbi:Lactate utilization protein A 2 [Geodia barretti]|uniref:Lactate utilization protein A 2 n=1 Tax=Geodia barretti TaxID=519541 RepID=A0AA35WEZ5_GEOBA|nr:Lactate utilization protein A 2 [Geodia barretti]
MRQGRTTRVDLFATCIVDQLFPDVGVSVVRVLRRLGVEVGYPEGQTCCGQALYNSGYRREAREMAVRTLGEFGDSEYVVVPSGSCAAMMRVFYLDLFEDEPEMLRRAVAMSHRVYEFSEFLVKVLGANDTAESESGISGGFKGQGSAAFHHGCHLLREMEVRDEPRALLGAVEGLEVRELRDAETCCGFGGSFSVKLPHISEGMLADKVASVRESGADTLVSCDMSCLMHIGGALRREDPDIKIRHIAQVLDEGSRG